MIIGAAPVDSARLFKEFDPRRYYVICADAGYETALKVGVKPDLIVGDFDSAKEPPAKGQKDRQSDLPAGIPGQRQRDRGVCQA